MLHNILNEDTRKKNLTGCGKYNFTFSSRNRKGTVRSSFLLFRDVFPLGWMEERERPNANLFSVHYRKCTSVWEGLFPSGCVSVREDSHYRPRGVKITERQSRKEVEYTLFLLEYK